MSLWGFYLCEYLSADNVLNMFMDHSTNNIWALYNSSVIWWSAIITIFRRGNKAQRILFTKILVHSVRTIGCCHNSPKRCFLSIWNICPASTHSWLICFSRNLSSLSVWLYVNVTQRFLDTAPVKCISELAFKTKVDQCSKSKRVESVFLGYLSPHSGGNWSPET